MVTARVSTRQDRRSRPRRAVRHGTAGWGGWAPGPSRRPPDSRAVDLELPEGVAPLGTPGRAEHPHEPAGAGDGQILDATGTGGRREEGAPGVAVVRGLELEGPTV